MNTLKYVKKAKGALAALTVVGSLCGLGGIASAAPTSGAINTTWGKAASELQLNQVMQQAPAAEALNKLCQQASGAIRLGTDPAGGYSLGSAVPPGYNFRDWTSIRPIYAGYAQGYQAAINQDGVTRTVNVNLYALQRSRSGNKTGTLVTVTDAGSGKVLMLRTLLSIGSELNETQTFGLAPDGNIFRRNAKKGENILVSALGAFGGRSAAHGAHVDAVLVPSYIRSGSTFDGLRSVVNHTTMALDTAASGNLATIDAEKPWAAVRDQILDTLKSKVKAALKDALDRVKDYVKSALLNLLKDYWGAIVSWFKSFLGL